jgi:Leucine-rich repeat (LRR) protein
MDKVQEQAIKEIKGLGGVIDTDDRVSAHPVVGVDLDRSLITDKVLVPLQSLKQLHYLFLSRTRVTDKIMDVLRIHPEIKRLNVSGTLITDNGLRFLKYGESLEELYLGDNITDKGFMHVKWLKKLRILALEESSVTDNGLRYISSLENLEYLFLSANQVSTESIRWLRQLRRLQTINLLGHSNSPDDAALILLTTSLPSVKIEW